MPHMLILADDLSGASDCAIASSACGLTATVALGDLPHNLPAHVVAIDCDTRHLDPVAAANKTVRLLHRYHPSAECLLFKKLDSTLRGNVAAELAAVLSFRRSVSNSPSQVVAVMAPAFPAGGRTTVAGHQLVRGSPLHTAEVWGHQRSACQTHIPSLLALSGLRPTHLALALIRSGYDALRSALIEGAIASDVLVCDAETDDDLRAIAHASLVLGRETVWAGSAGLARHLPAAAGLSGGSPVSSPCTLAEGPTLMVIGSMSDVAHRQVEELGHVSEVGVIVLPAGVLLAGPLSPEWSGCAVPLRSKLLAGGDVALVVGAGGPSDPNIGRQISAALAIMTEPVAEMVGALVASGGETARAILELWGVTGLRLLGELEPGLPIAVTEGWRRPLPVLTKAGAFGNPMTLIHCAQFLHALDRHTGRMHLPEKEAS